MIDTKTDELACPACKTREDLVVTGLDVAAILGRYQSDNDATGCVTCFASRTSVARPRLCTPTPPVRVAGSGSIPGGENDDEWCSDPVRTLRRVWSG